MRYTPIFLSVILAIFALSASAQNLIPNPGFEGNCSPGALGNGNFGADHWYNANAGTFDFYAAAEPSPSCFLVDTESLNWELYNEVQAPFEGDRFVGGIMYMSSFCIREMIQCKLLEPLQEGKIYCFSMQVAFSGMFDRACNGVGVALSADSTVNFASSCTLGLTPLIQFDEVVSDTENWMTLSIEFVAAGGEQYLTIGNQLDDADVSSEVVDGSTASESAYYYFDMLSLENCEQNSIGESSEIVLQIVPNPTSSMFQITNIENNEPWKVVDYLGKMVLSGNGPIGDVSSLARGCYVVVAKNAMMRLVVE
ncbi:MAG: hypothetical protein GC193_05430 [Cryomorphaceae bacterium]|nr:hypothetical protein [Cryomorphaceae bacterium]